MRLLLVIFACVLVGWYIFDHVLTPVPAPPPPMPPVISRPPTPAPVLKSEDVERLIESTKDMEPSVRWAALKLLTDTNTPQAPAVMYGMLMHDADPGVRKNIVALLETRPSAETTRRLVMAVGDGDPEVRVAVLEVLAKIGDDSTSSSVSDALRDTDERVRLQAIKTLNALQTKRAAGIQASQERERQAAQAAAQKQ